MSTDLTRRCGAGLLWAAGTVFSLLSGSEGWVVPAISPPITCEFPGFIEADRAKQESLFSPGTRSVVAWMALPGTQAVAGDVLMTFDTQLVARDLPQRQAEFDESLASYRLELLKLDRERADLLDRISRARADLAAKRAQIAGLGADDAAQLALAQAARDQAHGDLTSRERELVRIRARADAGDASRNAVDVAEHAVALARLDLAAAQATETAAETRDRNIERSRLLLDEQELMGTLGLSRTADGGETADPAAGLPGRLAQLDNRRQAQEAALAGERDARRTAWHDAVRELHDHCPLDWLTLTPVGGQARRIDFAPTAPAAGWEWDGGAVFSTERGWGWDRDLRDRMAMADEIGGSISADDTWCLVRERATWSLAAPDGAYHLEIGFGADTDWDGMVVRCDDGRSTRVVFARNRLEAKTHVTATAEVQLSGGRLRLLVGGEPGKHLFAPGTGTFLLNPRTERGRKVDWRGRPLAYLVPPAAVRINARAPAEIANLLGTRNATADDLRTRSATADVRIALPGQADCPGTVLQVGSKPAGIRTGPGGWNEEEPGSPQDLTHREISIALPPDAAARAGLRSRVTVHCVTNPPAGITAVPPWLVAWRDSVAWIRSAGAWRQVTAVRAGPRTLVAGLVPGTVLELPVGTPPAAPAQPTLASDSGGGYPGEVIAGQRLRVVMPGGWGRVATFVPDGSEVRLGDELLTMYNPVIDQQRDQLDRDRRQAERGFAEAAAARRNQLLESAEARRNDQLAEGRARLDLESARRPDETLAATAIRSQRATLDAERAAAVAATTAQLIAAPDIELAQRREAAARAGLLAQRSTLETVRTGNARDWLQTAQLSATWEDALGVLGQKEAKDQLARANDRAATARAVGALARADQDRSWVAEFERNRVLRANGAGRLYWLTVWNEQTRTRSKLTKDVWVWGGMPLAEIVDLGRLSFSVEVPEALYPRLQTGQKLAVRFPVLGDRRLDATIAAVGQAIAPPRDLASAARDEKVTDTRVFTLTLDLVIPADAHGQVQPGLRGILELP
jgi:multidrug efflux pump subunit AcrA (membrane-fusion protein)